MNKQASPFLNSFERLSDTPNTYQGCAGQVLKVNADESGVDFGNPSVPSGVPCILSPGWVPFDCNVHSTVYYDTTGFFIVTGVLFRGLGIQAITSLPVINVDGFDAGGSTAQIINAFTIPLTKDDKYAFAVPVGECQVSVPGPGKIVILVTTPSVSSCYNIWGAILGFYV